MQINRILFQKKIFGHLLAPFHVSRPRTPWCFNFRSEMFTSSSFSTLAAETTHRESSQQNIMDNRTIKTFSPGESIIQREQYVKVCLRFTNNPGRLHVTFV